MEKINWQWLIIFSIIFWIIGGNIFRFFSVVFLVLGLLFFIKTKMNIIEDSILKFIDFIRGYFELGFEIKYFIEIALLITAVTLFYFHKEAYLPYLLVIWSVAAFFGFFIPKNKSSSVIQLPNSERYEDRKMIYPGIPLNIELISRGGFIAGKIIELRVSILEIDEKYSSKDYASVLFKEVQVVYFDSWRAPIRRYNKFLKGSPESGGVSIDLTKNSDGCQKVIFPNAGTFYPALITKDQSNKDQLIPVDRSDSNLLPPSGKITISPHESYLTVRNNAIIYSLTIVTLLLALIQTKVI